MGVKAKGYFKTAYNFQCVSQKILNRLPVDYEHNLTLRISSLPTILKHRGKSKDTRVKINTKKQTMAINFC